MEKKRIPILVPQRLRPQNNEGKDCDCMNREYLLKYKQGTMRWLKTQGQRVVQDECICEAEIEKKVFEIPAPADGILDECCVENEAEFKCSQVLGYILCDENN